MPRKRKDVVNLPQSGATDDTAMERVIAAQARANALAREVAALRKDRDGLLEEFTDLRQARKVPRSPDKRGARASADIVRVYAGDVHGMRMDRDAVGAFLADIDELDPDEIVLGGDILECGGHLARHQPIGYVALCDYTYQEDVAAANAFLDDLQAVAKRARVLYLEGNHEHRVERWCVDQALANQRDADFLRAVYGPATLLRLAERGIKYYPQAEIHGEGLPRGWVSLGNMYAAHNIVEGRNAASKAVDKSAGNVTYFHTHAWDQSAKVLPSVGLVVAFSPGCLCEMQPMWRHSDPSGWNQGYDIDFVAASGNFQRVHVPIWRGKSLAGAMVERFRG